MRLHNMLHHIASASLQRSDDDHGLPATINSTILSRRRLALWQRDLSKAVPSAGSRSPDCGIFEVDFEFDLREKCEGGDHGRRC